jgi:hypothetical protein
MIYQEYLKEEIMGSRHAFIYGEKNERKACFESLAKEYSFDSLVKRPVGIYINDTGLADCNNLDCDAYIINIINSNYFEILVSLEIIDKLIKEVKSKEEVEDSILKFFNLFAMQNKLKSLTSLRDELLNTKMTFISEYNKYITTGEYKDFQSKLNIFSIKLDLLIVRLKRYLPTLERINLLIDKEGDYSLIYTQVINFYLSARSNADLSIKVGCDGINDWSTYHDINGTFVQAMHDYDTIDMDEYKLIRRGL